MNKRLIICSPQLGLSPQSDLGGEVYDREILRRFCQLGYKVVVILPKNKPCFKHRNLKIYYLPVPFVWPPYLFNLMIIPYLFLLIKKEKFNILRIHSPYFAGIGAVFFKLFYCHLPLVAVYHHLENKFLFKLIDKILLKKFDCIIADSSYTKNEIKKNYQLKENKLFVSFSGVSSSFKAKKKKKELVKKYRLSKYKVLLYLGGLKKRKNVFFLLKIMDKLKKFKVKLLIVGKGSEEEMLKRGINNFNLKNKVFLTGFIKEKEKIDYYNLADVFLYPSLLEGFGLAVLEANACGVPVIASDNSSLKEIVINGKTGYLAKENNLEDWLLKIKKLLTNENLRKKMAREAKNYSKKFNWLKTAKEQIKIFKLICSKKQL